MDRAFLKARIEKTKALIESYEDAVLSLSTGRVESYTLDTGQTRQTVTRINLQSMNAALDGLYNRLATLEARLNGGGITLRPDW